MPIWTGFHCKSEFTSCITPAVPVRVHADNKFSKDTLPFGILHDPYDMGHIIWGMHGQYHMAHMIWGNYLMTVSVLDMQKRSFDFDQM